MYEERKDSFTLKDVVIQILFVVLFVFILLWLFPSKNFVKDYVNKALQPFEDMLTPIQNRIFNENVKTMKEAAISYYTNERLPKKVGDTVSMTLSEMLTNKLVLPFTDKNGEECDLTGSYVEVTKMADEYRMKVNLKCGNEEDYLITHLGCYQYCNSAVCEKQETPVTNTGNSSNTGSTNKPTPTPTPSPKPDTKPDTKPDPKPQPEKKYKYEYELVTNGKWGSCDGNWSSWSTNKVDQTAGRDVKTQVKNEFSHYDYKTVTKYRDVQEAYTVYERVAVGTKQELLYTKEEKVLIGNDIKKVAVGTHQETYYKTETVPGSKVCTPKTEYNIKSYKALTTTSNVKYTLVKMDYERTCAGCGYVPVYYYNKTTTTCTTGSSTTKRVPYTVTVTDYEYRKVPVYEIRKTPVYKTVTVYENRPVTKYRTVQQAYQDTEKTPVYKNVTYYSYCNKTYISGNRDVKWSTSQNDTSLTSKGYKLTGRVQEVKSA